MTLEIRRVTVYCHDPRNAIYLHGCKDVYIWPNTPKNGGMCRDLTKPLPRRRNKHTRLRTVKAARPDKEMHLGVKQSKSILRSPMVTLLELLALS